MLETKTGSLKSFSQTHESEKEQRRLWKSAGVCQRPHWAPGCSLTFGGSLRACFAAAPSGVWLLPLQEGWSVRDPPKVWQEFLLSPRVTHAQESGFNAAELSPNTIDCTLRPHRRCAIKVLLLISGSAPLCTINVCSARPRLNRRQTFHIGRITLTEKRVCVCALTETSYGEDYWGEAKRLPTPSRLTAGGQRGDVTGTFTETDVWTKGDMLMLWARQWQSAAFSLSAWHKRQKLNMKNKFGS